jgi:hypothetical protein
MFDCCAHAGQLNADFAETLRYAQDLPDIVQEGVAHPEALSALEEVRVGVKAVSALLTASQTIH